MVTLLRQVLSLMAGVVGFAFALLAVFVPIGFNIRKMNQEKTFFIDASDMGNKLFFLLAFLAILCFMFSYGIERPDQILPAAIVGLCAVTFLLFSFGIMLWHLHVVRGKGAIERFFRSKK